jgi:beta-1,4-mannosyl-glycoprotein beta-1,4-N-acetylglucosaminyltransferase
MIPPILKSRPGYLLLLFAFLLISLIYLISSSLPRGAVAYSLRPLWDRDEAPNQPIPHLYSENLTQKELCNLHGWELREDTSKGKKRQVWDAVSQRDLSCLSTVSTEKMRRCRR